MFRQKLIEFRVEGRAEHAPQHEIRYFLNIEMHPV
jgi:hypothetical protein